MKTEKEAARKKEDNKYNFFFDYTFSVRSEISFYTEQNISNKSKRFIKCDFNVE